MKLGTSIITIVIGLLFGLQLEAAGDIVSRVEAVYRQAKDLQADFSQSTFIEILDREETRTGKLYIGTNRFRIEYHEPVKQFYVYDGKTLWIYSPKHKEVEIYQDSNERISREAIIFLGGLGNLRETFRIPKTQQEGDRTRITLIPKDNDSRLKKLELVVDSKRHHIKEAQLWPKQGNRSHYIFSDLKTDESLPDKKFSFKPPRGVAVIHPDQ